MQRLIRQSLPHPVAASTNPPRSRDFPWSSPGPTVTGAAQSAIPFQHSTGTIGRCMDHLVFQGIKHSKSCVDCKTPRPSTSHKSFAIREDYICNAPHHVSSPSMASADVVKAELEDDMPEVQIRSEGKMRYKSWRKKYRKMRLGFEDLMEDANQLFIAEHKARNVARRLQEEIEFATIALSQATR